MSEKRMEKSGIVSIVIIIISRTSRLFQRKADPVETPAIPNFTFGELRYVRQSQSDHIEIKPRLVWQLSSQYPLVRLRFW